jgi:lipid A 3-O-deacylase
VENDLFSGRDTDGHYTNGLRAAWVSENKEWPRGFANAIAPPGVLRTLDPGSATHRVGAGINQNLFTPQDTAPAHLIREDRPYAAWLYATFLLQSTYREGTEPSTQDTWSLDLGMTGPVALGDETQNNFHDVIGANRAFGWGNQLKSEPTLGVSFERKYKTRSLDLLPSLGLALDAVPNFVASVGNAYTYAGAGTLVRLGNFGPNDFGPARIRPTVPGSDTFYDGAPWRAYLFGGLQGRLIARNMFLDGNAFRDSHSVDKKHAVGDLLFGFAVAVGHFRFAYTHTVRTKEFHGQDRWDQFGSMSFSVAF